MPNYSNAGHGPRLVVDNGAVTDRGLTDAKIKAMSDSQLTNIANNFEAYQGDRVRARWELSRREVNAAYRAGEAVFHETDDDLDGSVRNTYPSPENRLITDLEAYDLEYQKSLTGQAEALTVAWLKLWASVGDVLHDTFIVPLDKFLNNRRR